MSQESFSLELTRESGYRMKAASGRDGAEPFYMDEAPPVGTGEGATPTELLAAAVGGCLSASLIFCLEKSRAPAGEIRTRVEGSLERNEKGRLRVSDLRVTLEFDGPEGDPARVNRCLDLFEDFCIVKESIRQGIPISVTVQERSNAPV